MIQILVVVGLLTLIAVAALLGSDSRDGRDWQPRDGSWAERGAPHH